MRPFPVWHHQPPACGGISRARAGPAGSKKSGWHGCQPLFMRFGGYRKRPECRGVTRACFRIHVKQGR